MFEDKPIQPKRNKLKIILTILGVVIVAVAVGLLVVKFIQENTASTPSSNTSATHEQVAIEKIVNEYGGEGGAALFVDSQPQPLSGVAGTFGVFYAAPSSEYSVRVTAQHAVGYPVSLAQAKVLTGAKAYTTQYLQAIGFQLDTSLSESSSMRDASTYASDSAVCQLFLADPVEGADGMVQFGCVTKADVQKEYEFTQKLLALHSSNEGGAIKEASRNYSVTEGDKSLTLLTVRKAERTVQELYAAIGDDWEYIATTNDGSGAVNGKYSLSDDARAALSDPKYGDFLTRNLWITN